MNFTKDCLRDSGINGYRFKGIWDNFAHYSKEIRENSTHKGYACIKVKESDITSGSYVFMLENDITYEQPK